MTLSLQKHRADEQVYIVKDIHNHSLVLISGIISQKLQEVAQVSATSVSISTVFQTAGSPLALGATPLAQPLDSDITSSNPTVPVSTVSWQTAFWSLLAIALNTCLQDCGSVCAINRDFALLVRSSPIVCLVDTLIIFLQFICYTVRNGPRRAIRIVAISRNQHTSRLPRQNITPTQYLVGGILFAMAVIQSIKLFALSGIPWAQFFGACYLSSYLFNALLNALGKPKSELDSIEISLRANTCFSEAAIKQSARLAAAGQIVVWTASLKGILPEDEFDFLGVSCAGLLYFVGSCLVAVPLLSAICITATSFLFVDLGVVFVPAAITLGLCFVHLRSGWPSVIELTMSVMGVTDETAAIGIGAFFALAWLMLHICVYPFYVSGAVLERLVDGLSPKALLVIEEWGPYGPGLVLVILAAFLSYVVARIFLFGVLAEKLHLRHLSIASNMGSACLFLFTANIYFTLLYYTVLYDPEGTYKPSWTENLGR